MPTQYLKTQKVVIAFILTIMYLRGKLFNGCPFSMSHPANLECDPASTEYTICSSDRVTQIGGRQFICSSFHSQQNDNVSSLNFSCSLLYPIRYVILSKPQNYQDK